MSNVRNYILKYVMRVRGHIVKPSASSMGSIVIRCRSTYHYDLSILIILYSVVEVLAHRCRQLRVRFPAQST